MSFASALLGWFERHGRRGLPWRTTRDPYRTVVSEFMLQQTQVERVVPAFERFVATWPNFASLAAASRADVVRAWQGLGYNSRAVRLHRLAAAVCDRFGGRLPEDESALRSLPGVGPYTARAIAAFGFDRDVLAIDTNVRRVVHRTQLGIEWPPLATAAELDALGAELVPARGGYAFNSALMDLGASVCTARTPKCLVCPLRQQCAAAPIDVAGLAERAALHAPPRSPQARLRFEETDRYLRGRVVDRLRALEGASVISLLDLDGALSEAVPNYDRGKLEGVLEALASDGVVERAGTHLRLAR